MDLFRDQTRRPGPSTWAAGHYPAGKDDFPVSGVSWYEAAAYAAFAGKSLPVLAQSLKLAGEHFDRYVEPFSNLSSDLARGRTIRGRGSVRHLRHGRQRPRMVVECRGRGPSVPARTAGQLVRARDAAALRSVAAQRFPLRAERRADSRRGDGAEDEAATRFLEERASLRRDVPGVSRTCTPTTRRRCTRRWRRFPIPVRTGPSRRSRLTRRTGRERVAAFLFLPKNARPPFQTVVFFPSARVNILTEQRESGRLDLHGLRRPERPGRHVSHL